MQALSDFFFHLYAKTIVLLVFLLIELIILVRNLKTHTPPMTISQYLQLIEEKTPTVCFTRTLNMADQQECRVCLSELQEGDKVRTLKCKHTFHQECLDRWLLQFWATCPLCRNRVLPEDVVTDYQRLRNQRELIIFPFWESSED
ncbi:hypothetical protein QN277_006403 [Acacia crassicarpa]|uniref:RING-type domain-containing protein n=1 Tax=Acacia crassicarpa TaxID=499986 RepID=A0AAE1ISC9_9FABA|nr:hypothetical protein QN277_006403 [Acacia crassicarpa]